MGRLIDADALAEGYKHMGYDPTEHPEESYMEGWCNGFNAAVDHCMHHVIHAPTIEERKTGRWIGKYPVTSACSECNYLIHDSKVKVFAYCPNCGAKMEG